MVTAMLESLDIITIGHMVQEEVYFKNKLKALLEVFYFIHSFNCL